MITFNHQKMNSDADYKALVDYCMNLRIQLSAVADTDDPSALQSKIARQRKANQALNDRVFNQRTQLRFVNDAGRGLTKEEWDQLKAENVRLEGELPA